MSSNKTVYHLLLSTGKKGTLTQLNVIDGGTCSPALLPSSDSPDLLEVI